MGLETGTYISDLVSTNPTASDPKSQGDDHVRLIKACAKATFPNVSNAITATHTELNYSVGVTSAIQTQINAKGAITGQAWTGSHTFVTQSAADNSTKAATTAYVDAADALKANLASPALTGTPTAPTAAGGTNTTQVATTAFVQQQAFSAALPVQSGNASKFLTTDGANASWATAQWVEISHVTASGTSVAFTGIASTYHDLLLVLENVAMGSALSALQVALGDSTPTYTSALSITGTGTASDVTGGILISNSSNDFGIALAVADQTNAVSSPAIASGTMYPIRWCITGGVRAVKITVASGFTGGVVRLMGR